jgi:hypothetical protein
LFTTKLSIQETGGTIAVGSLVLFGLFLLIDGLLDAFSIIEPYAATATWTILVSVPLLVISYLLGVVTSQIAHLLLLWPKKGPDRAEIDNFIAVALLKNEAIMERYTAIRRNEALLFGSSAALIVVAVGCIAERRRRWIGIPDDFFLIIAFDCLALAVTCFILQNRYIDKGITFRPSR